MSSYVLSRVLPEPGQRFQAMLDDLVDAADPRFTLAEVNDLLTGITRIEMPAALEGADSSRLPPFLQNYVAAMVEEAAHRVEVGPPAWVTGIPPLDMPCFATPLPGLRLHLVHAAPVPFKRRNIFIDASLGARV